MNPTLRSALYRLVGWLRQAGGTGWKLRAAYGAFFALAFLFAFRQTFPVQALKERLILEAGAHGWRVDAEEVGPAGLVGMSATGVTLVDRAGTTLALDEVSVSFRILLDPSVSIAEAHAESDRVERDLRLHLAGLGRVVIHAEPAEEVRRRAEA